MIGQSIFSLMVFVFIQFISDPWAASFVLMELEGSLLFAMKKVSVWFGNNKNHHLCQGWHQSVKAISK